jgi:DNA adenine methylase
MQLRGFNINIHINNSTMARPVLKWAGGKRRLIKDIMRLLPTDYHARGYHEPFFGGGALFFHLEPETGSINDVNKKLMNFYKVLRDNPLDLIEEASKFVYEKSEYYRLRTNFNRAKLGKVEEAAILLYLNKTGYNGLYRVNSKGDFNVPFGRYKSPKIVDKDRIIEASVLLRNIEIFSGPFQRVTRYANKGDIVYLDPPYLPTSQTSDFTSYSNTGFNYRDHILLKDVCYELHKKGVLFIQSNIYFEPILKLYQDSKVFYVEEVLMNRPINSKASKRGKVKEILITNIPKIGKIDPN